MKDKPVIVCVTAQESSKLLVKSGKMLAEKYNSPLEVVSVLPPNNENTAIDIPIIEQIHHMTKEFGGDMMLYFHEDPVLTLIAHIGKRKPMTVVTGYPGENSNNFIDGIRLLLPMQEISMVNGDQIYTLLPKMTALNID